MNMRTLEHEIWSVMKKAPVDFYRLWGRNALSKPAGLMQSTAGPSGADDGPEEALKPLSVEDVEVFSVVSPDTFTLLPVVPGEVEVPMGVMLCDVYEVQDGGVQKIQAGADLEHSADLYGGIAGAGIEFFYPGTAKDFRCDDIGLSVSIFRDTLNPAIPRRIQKALFDLGAKRQHKEPTDCKSMPALRSAV